MQYKKLIKIVQAEANLNMRQLARKLDVAQGTVYARIAKNDPSYSELEQLAEIAGVSVEKVIEWGK